MTEYGKTLVEAMDEHERAIVLTFLDRAIMAAPTRELHLAFAETYHRNDGEDADVWRPSDFRHAFNSMLHRLRSEIAEESGR